MAIRDLKWFPTSLVVVHFQSYRDATSGKHSLSDHIAFEGVPALVFIVVLVARVEVSPMESVGLLTVCGVMATLLFSAFIQLSQRVKVLVDTGERTEAYAEEKAFLGEAGSNAGFASLVALTASVFFAVSAGAHGVTGLVASSVGLALGVYLVMLFLMVLKRVNALLGHDLRQ
jgi:hypothetical protein